MGFKVDRKEAEAIGWNFGVAESPGSCESLHQRFMILSVLMDIRDLLMDIEREVNDCRRRE